MSRLLSSLGTAAAVLADQAADRLDAWVENTTGADEAPRETPIGFTVPTGERGNGINAMGLTGEQRDRWLAEVKARLDASTGGPWCTEERDNPTGRITSPYGVIATGVTREADRDLIEDARADLYGLLALAEYTADYAARAGNAERKLDAHHRHDAATDADTVRARAAERILAYAAEEKPRVNDTYGQVYLSGLETAAALIVDEATEGEPSADIESPFLPAPQARAEAHLIKVALNHIDEGHDPRGVLHFNDRPLAARVVGTIMNARTDAIAEFVKHQVTHCRDHSANALDEDRTLAVRMGVAPAALLDEGELSPTESNAATVIIKAGGKFTPSVEGAVAQNAEGAILNSNGDRIITYGGGSAGDNPPAHIVVTSAGYVRDVIEDTDDEAPANLVTTALERHGVIDADDRHVGAQVKRPNPLDDLDGGTDG